MCVHRKIFCTFIWPVCLLTAFVIISHIFCCPYMTCLKQKQKNDYPPVVRVFNPILTGGGSIWPPPCTKSATVSRPPLIATRLFMTFFFQSYASFDTKFAKIGPSVARSCDFLYSHVGSKIAQNPHFAYVCVQNTWKLQIFLKCSKTMFILSFWPFVQFCISWN